MLIPKPFLQNFENCSKGSVAFGLLGRHEQEAHTSAQRPVSDDAEAFNSSLILEVDSKELGRDDDTTFNLSHFFEMQVQGEPDNAQDLEMLSNPQRFRSFLNENFYIVTR